MNRQHRFGNMEAEVLLSNICARATESTLPIWLRVMGTLQTGAFNFSIVK